MKKLLAGLLVLGSISSFAESKDELRSKIFDQEKIIQSYEEKIETLTLKVDTLENPNIINNMTFVVSEVEINQHGYPSGSSVFDANLMATNGWKLGLYCSESESGRHKIGLGDGSYATPYKYLNLNYELCQKILDSQTTVTSSNPLVIVVKNFDDEESIKLISINL